MSRRCHNIMYNRILFKSLNAAYLLPVMPSVTLVALIILQLSLTALLLDLSVQYHLHPHHDHLLVLLYYLNIQNLKMIPIGRFFQVNMKNLKIPCQNSH